MIVGNDDVIPFYRVADTTTIGNESNYAMGTFLKPGSPLFHSTDEGYILTQDFYADLVPTPYEGGALYVPDLPIGRLVETPMEIQAQADAFVASDGQLAVETAAVAGYDFFTDYSDGVAAEAIAAGIVTDNLTNDFWTGDELRCDWGLSPTTEAPICAPDGVPSISSAAAHYTHWAALSAGGFFNGDYTDYVSSTEFVAPPPSGTFEYHLGFTIGCHAGFIVPDDDVVDGVFPFNPALDLAQAMAQNRAIWVASTGYAIGDDEALNYTELLMLHYSEGLLSGSGYAGQALVDAKLAYLGALGTITNYDQKVSIEMTLYGLPHYQAVTPATVAAASAIQTQLKSLASSHVSPGPGLTSVETQTIEPVFERHSTASGSYDAGYDGLAGGTPDYETVPGRPIMPRIVVDLAPLAEGPVHGAILVDGSYTLEDPFNPWIGVPMLEWTEVPPEAQVCLPIYWPTPVKLNALGSDDDLDQRAITYPAAFRCDPLLSVDGIGDPSESIGQYRTFSSQTMRFYRSTSDDITPPIIHEVNLSDSAVSGGVVVSVDASDSESDIVEVIVVRYRDGANPEDGDVTAFSYEPVPVTSGVFNVDVTDFDPEDEFVVHVVDAGGNIATYSAKGYLLQFIDVDAGEDQFVAATEPVFFTGTISGFGDLVAPVRYLWSFGDGETRSGDISGLAHDEGNADFTVDHLYSTGGTFEATLRIVDSAGATGFDSATVYACGTDPEDVILDLSSTIEQRDADILKCAASIDSDLNQATITLYMADDIADAGGQPTMGDIQYRLRLGVVGQSNEKLVKYRDGNTTGMKSLEVKLSGNTISFTFNLAELGRTGPLSDAAVTFSVETRDGAQSTGSAGLLDWMPDDAGVIEFNE